MGDQVRKVTVDGKDFFGDDATAALRNLPADVIDKIQVFDRLSDQAQLTGFDDGNSVKTVNIVTKNGIRNGQFGRIYAGAGTDGRYTAGGNVSFFKGERRLSLVGNFNNINLQNFSSQDLLGVTSTGGGGGRGDDMLTYPTSLLSFSLSMTCVIATTATSRSCRRVDVAVSLHSRPFSRGRTRRGVIVPCCFEMINR